MVHPTCAHARLPDPPPGGESPLHPTGADLVVLSTQATDEIGALREAYRAIACIRDMLDQLQGSPGNEGRVCPVEVKALMAFVNTEFKRRLKSAKATLALFAAAQAAQSTITSAEPALP